MHPLRRNPACPQPRLLPTDVCAQPIRARKDLLELGLRDREHMALLIEHDGAGSWYLEAIYSRPPAEDS